MTVELDDGDVSRINKVEARFRGAMTEGAAGVVSTTPPQITQEQYTQSPALADFGKTIGLAIFRSMRELPVRLPIYTVSTVPSVAQHIGAIIYVSNGAFGSPVIAFSDGYNWLRCDDLTTISV